MNRWIGAMVFACLAATAIPAARPVTALPHPTLLETSDTVELSNKQISLVIDKATGQILSWHLAGGPDVLTKGKTVYFDANGGGPVPSPRKAGTRRMEHAEYRLVRNNEDFIEVAFGFAGDDIFPFDTELHYVLRPGDSGVYCFVVYRHGPNAPPGSLGQTRLVIKLKRDLFTHYFVNDQTQGEFPTLADPNAKPTPVTDATAMFPGGRIATKYNLADFQENHHVHGVAGPAGGVWVISASNEYLNGGPTKQDLQVHEDDVIVLKMLHSGHFLIRTGMDFPAGQEWTKFYGPFFLYLNRAATPQAAWEDAKARAKQEQAAWPYTWTEHPAYPWDRGQVAGRLMIQGRTPAANACVILADKDGDWQTQGKGYTFWTRTADDGAFTLQRVRPGQYTLYAFVPGQAGELRRDGVSVDADKTADLGPIDFEPLTHGRTLWQIGTPDRTCGEFRYGGLPRQFGLWNKYLADFPDDVTFHVGKSRERTDWNYCQPVVQKPDGSWHCPTWRVVFDSPAAQTGKAVLMIGIAGAVREPELVVRVNDTEIGRQSQKLPNDGSVYRDATLAGQYRLWTVEFDASLLKQGRNVLSLELVKSNPADAAYDPHSLPRAAVMYDFLRLEVAP